jgi:ribosomal protein S18 acetylase RimI-like enzyme
MTQRTSFTIRPARPGDVEAASALWWAMARQHEAYDDVRWGHTADAGTAWRRYFLAELEKPDAIALVAVDGRDRPVGYLLGATGEPPPVMRVRCRGLVGGIVVRDDRRGQGVGRALMAEAERIMKSRGAAYVSLSVATANEPAIRFYESLGMQAVNRQMYKRL